MATRRRESNVREKTTIRGTSPSAHSPNPSSSSSSSKTSPNHGISDNKNIPNYLKPTISSRPDHASKKPVSGDIPTLTRRRSFDKPIPTTASRMQKSRVSPNPTLRSSSFQAAGKTTINTSKNPKAGATTKDAAASKQRTASHLHARPASSVTTHGKKSTTVYVVKKQETTEANKTTSSATADDHVQVITDSTQEKVDSPTANAPKVPDETQPQEHHDDSSFPEEAAEDLEIQVPSNNEKEAEDFQTKDQGSIAAEVDHKEAESKIINVEPSTISGLHDDDDSVSTNKTEDTFEDKPQIEETSTNKLQELEEQTMHKTSSFTDAEEQNQREGDEGARKEEAATGSETPELKETSDEENVAEDEKKEVEAPKQQVTQGKKLDSPVSNNVIEETASKLREQRKNKVKALAGAFETVISLQEPK